MIALLEGNEDVGDNNRRTMVYMLDYRVYQIIVWL